MNNNNTSTAVVEQFTLNAKLGAKAHKAMACIVPGSKSEGATRS
jgi:hypothetical protein